MEILSINIPAFSLIFSFIALSLWLLFQQKKGVSPILAILFWFGMGYYVFQTLTSDLTLDNKFFNLSRDLIVIASASFFLSFFKKKTWLFLVLLGGLSYLGVQYYLPITKPEPKSNNSATIEEIDYDQYDAYDEDGELLLDLKSLNHPKLDAVLHQYNLRLKEAFQPEDADITELDDYRIIDLPADQISVFDEIFKRLKATGELDDLEWNEKVQISPVEAQKIKPISPIINANDPDISKQWGLSPMKVGELYTYLKRNNIQPKKKAWIAILDTGVDAKHEDIAVNYKSFRKKYDRDGNRHGTHCAGIAAAVSNNKIGIASFAPTSDFVEVGSIQVLGRSGSGTQAGIIKGIIEAADKGADVISLSLGARSNSSRETAYKKAVDYANEKGAIVIAAAGNSNRNAKDYSPANTKGVITVSAISQTLEKAFFSNTVQDVKMGIAAPGVDIHSTIPNNQYAALSGTSMATPYVAGLVGLMKSIQPNLTTQEVYDLLHSTGIDTKNTTETGKLIQPVEVIKQLK